MTTRHAGDITNDLLRAILAELQAMRADDDVIRTAESVIKADFNNPKHLKSF